MMSSAIATARGDAAVEPRRLLEIYLRDHLAGAAGGVALATRCRRNNGGTRYEATLADIEREIREDRDSLQAIMDALGVEPSRMKTALGTFTELISRLKSNGRLVRYSPSSRVIELEALAAGVATKRSLWQTLRTAAVAPLLEIEGPTIDDLEERATSQLERLAELHDRACADAFATPA